MRRLPHHFRLATTFTNMSRAGAARDMFCSLGNFVVQNETIDPMPSANYEGFSLQSTALAKDVYDARFRNGTTGSPSSPVWYESVVAVPNIQGTELVEFEFCPIGLGQKRPRSQRGTPRLADAETGRDTYTAAC